MYEAIKRLLGPIPSLLHLPARLELHARVASACARAAATGAARQIDPRCLQSWAFSGFSQHGEDGILDYLCTQMRARNHFFVELGAADGLRNCSAWLAIARRYGGLMIEGDARLSRNAQTAMRELGCHNVTVESLQVDQDNIATAMKLCPVAEPDVFIIDIDGVDYHIVERVLSLGLTPKVMCVEYNSAFGPERAITVPCTSGFTRREAHPSLLYYGASIAAWRALLGRHGYAFAGLEANGVNAFFIRPEHFPDNFAGELDGPTFLENISDRNGATMPGMDATGDRYMPVRDWRTQFARISHLDYLEVD